MKVLKVFGLMGIFLFVALLPVRVHAADMKIASVDLGRLFDQYEKTKDYDKVLEGENAKFQEERNAKIDKIRELQGKAAMVKDEEKAKLDQEMETLKAEIIEFDRQKRTDLTKARDEKVREILLEIEKVVAEFAKKEKYTFVLNSRALIFGDEQVDVTDQVLKKLNADYSKAKK